MMIIMNDDECNDDVFLLFLQALRVWLSSLVSPFAPGGVAGTIRPGISGALQQGRAPLFLFGTSQCLE